MMVRLELAVMGKAGNGNGSHPISLGKQDAGLHQHGYDDSAAVMARLEAPGCHLLTLLSQEDLDLDALAREIELERPDLFRDGITALPRHAGGGLLPSLAKALYVGVRKGDDLRSAVFANMREKAMLLIVGDEARHGDNVRIIARRPFTGGFKVSGSARSAGGPRVRPQITVNHEAEIVEGTCTCSFFNSHKLTKGPCEHLLALRLAHMSRLSEEDSNKKKGGA
jgi:hypothetical protein